MYAMSIVHTTFTFFIIYFSVFASLLLYTLLFSMFLFTICYQPGNDISIKKTCTPALKDQLTTGGLILLFSSLYDRGQHQVSVLHLTMVTLQINGAGSIHIRFHGSSGGSVYGLVVDDLSAIEEYRNMTVTQRDVQ